MNLQQEMAELPEPTTNLKPPHWEYWRHELWQLAQSDNPANFMQWPCVYHTMLHNHWQQAIIQGEWQRLPSSFLDLALAPRHNTDIFREQLPYSLSLIHQLYNLHKFQQATNIKVSDLKTIYEFGGGFGQSVIAARRLGFTGKYYIYDLPEFALLQQWYLEENETEAIWLKSIRKRKVDLFIASYSLSEVAIDLRDTVLEKIQADNYLFLYSNRFEKYDNVNYFQGIGMDKKWQHEKLDHLPPESWYSFGS